MVTSAKAKQDIDIFLSLCLNFDMKETIILKKLPSEAAVRRCSFKKPALKTFSIFRRNHLKAWRPATLLKRDSKTGGFFWLSGNF